MYNIENINGDVKIKYSNISSEAIYGNLSGEYLHAEDIIIDMLEHASRNKVLETILRKSEFKTRVRIDVWSSMIKTPKFSELLTVTRSISHTLIVNIHIDSEITEEDMLVLKKTNGHIWTFTDKTKQTEELYAMIDNSKTMGIRYVSGDDVDLDSIKDAKIIHIDESVAVRARSINKWNVSECVDNITEHYITRGCVLFKYDEIDGNDTGIDIDDILMKNRKIV